MATPSLTPDMIRQILAAPSYSPTVNVGGNSYQAARSGGGTETSNDQGYDTPYLLGYETGKTEKGKDLYNMYDTGTGAYQGSGQFKDDEAGKMFAMFLLTALTMGVGLPALMGGAAAGGAGAGALAGAEGLGSLGGLGAEGFASSLGADLASAGFGGLEGLGGLGGLGAEGLGGLGGLAEGVGGLGLDTSLLGGGGFSMNSIPGLSGLGSEAGGFSGLINQGASFGGLSGPMFSGLSPELAGAALGSGQGSQSLLDQLISGGKSAAGSLGGASNLGGLATTALGGLLGSKGQETGGTTTNKIDPRLDPYIYGDQGILAQSNALKNQQLAQGGLNDLQRTGMQKTQDWLTSPQYAQGFGQMQNLGLGLMNRGIATNPFAK